MADEANEAPAPEAEAQDTPPATEEAAEATPSEEPTTPAEPETDYRKRYEDLRPEYDRSQQFFAALQGRQGPEAQEAAYRELGLELVDDDGQDTEDDLPPDPDERIEKLEKALAEREEREEQEHFQRLEEQFLEGELDKIAKEEDRDLSDDEVEVIVSYALANRHDDGRPDVEGGHAKLRAIYSNAQKNLIKPKRNAAKPGKGTAGVEKDDLSTPAGREQAALQAALEAQASAE